MSKVPQTIVAKGYTDKGKVRKSNEDAFAVRPELGLFVVSDGIGGHQAGEVASQLVTEVLPAQVTASLKPGGYIEETMIEGTLRELITELSRTIFERASKIGELRGMGATVAACLIRDDVLVVAHMGDSRIYLMREGVLERLTEDHTVRSLADSLTHVPAGAIDDASHHILTRYVGMAADVGPEVNRLTLRDGDVLLLCSDGLTNMVKDPKLAELLWCEPDPARSCRALVAAANAAGGKDNITSVVVQYGDSRAENRKREQVMVNTEITRFAKRARRTVP